MKTVLIFAAIAVSTVAVAQEKNSFATDVKVTAQSEVQVENKGATVSSVASSKAEGSVRGKKGDASITGETASESKQAIKADLREVAAEERSELKAELRSQAEMKREELAALKKDVKAESQLLRDATKSELKSLKTELKNDLKAGKEVALASGRDLKPEARLTGQLKTGTKLQSKRINSVTRLKTTGKLRLL